MTTLAAMETEVRDEINEATAGFWTSAEIKRWLNRGNRDLTRAYRLAADSAQSITTADGTEFYALASDFGAPAKVEIVDTSDSTSWASLRRIHPKERIDGKGEPAGYYIKGARIYLSPIPDGVYTVRVWYYRDAPTLTSSSDEPIIPSEFHDLIVDFAIARAKQKDDDPAYQTYDERYEKGKREMVEQRMSEEEGADQPTVVEYVDDDWTLVRGTDD